MRRYIQLRNYIDAAAFKEMILCANAALHANVQAINDLNVFPVPDGDTGTNMALTMDKAATELKKKEFDTIAAAADCVASALLRGARGNSGVILSLLFRGISKRLKGLDTAGAQEFAGAMQDNDRATIIGRRSFGKGLVQQQLEFPDHSLIRLTIARYYTPSGRCIQKPYTMGDDKDYEQDLLTRYQHGEFFSQDSIKHTGPAYHTGLGRVVYGGGGITPDIFVPEDTLGMTSYFKEASMSGLILQYAFSYTDDNRLKLNNFKEMMEMSDYLNKQNLVEQFATYADKHGLQRRNLLIKKSHKLLERSLNGRIIYNMLNEQAWTEYINQDDPVIRHTLEVFHNNAAFPKKPAAVAKKPLTKKKKK